uniref:hypothetical protein n=1 Tax=Candidatus Thiodubiliella endoseptemdiera TaxID=2738886 RepID=UPI0034DE83A6
MRLSWGPEVIVSNYTLCLLDPAQPGKADCGSGYESLSLSITSDATLTANEGTASTNYTLVASDTNASFSIVAGTNLSNLFSLSGTNNTALSFNSTNTDFESATKQYTVFEF